MDGILEELLRLEGAKNRALIDLGPATYEDSVQKRIGMTNDPGISQATCSGKDTLVANNTTLCESLLSTAPWNLAANRSYTGEGQTAEPAATHAFSAEV